MFSQLKYLLRKSGMELRDAIRGPHYRIEGTKLTLPRGGRPSLKSAVIHDTYERDEREMIKAFLPPELPVIEFGGSFGIVSFTIRRCLLPSQRLVVVEANPIIVPFCRANVEQAGSVENTTVVQAALAYGDGVVRFKLSDNVHTSHVVFDGSTGADIVDVPSVTLKSIRASHGITGPYCLVCDIEGAELILLRNEADALADCHMMILETHPADYGALGGSLEEVMQRIDALGFRVFNKRSDVVAARRG